MVPLRNGFQNSLEPLERSFGFVSMAEFSKLFSTVAVSFLGSPIPKKSSHLGLFLGPTHPRVLETFFLANSLGRRFGFVSTAKFSCTGLLVGQPDLQNLEHFLVRRP